MTGLFGFVDYQEQAATTAIYPSRGDYQAFAEGVPIYPHELLGLAYLGLKLAGEAGEISEKIGKAMRDGIADRRAWEELIVKELGDVLWYLSQIARELGYDFEHVAAVNMNKLSDRRERGVLGGSGDDR
jgi:NTP pyrophosphatase (non-canonical NTP hydrolase)